MAHRTPHSTLTWLGSDRPLARVIGRPMLRFLSVEDVLLGYCLTVV